MKFEADYTLVGKGNRPPNTHTGSNGKGVFMFTVRQLHPFVSSPIHFHSGFEGYDTAGTCTKAQLMTTCKAAFSGATKDLPPLSAE